MQKSTTMFTENLQARAMLEASELAQKAQMMAGKDVLFCVLFMLFCQKLFGRKNTMKTT